jgi:hypothetical protein
VWTWKEECFILSTKTQSTMVISACSRIFSLVSNPTNCCRTIVHPDVESQVRIIPYLENIRMERIP